MSFDLDNLYALQRVLDNEVQKKLSPDYEIGSYYDIDNTIYAFHTEVHELANEVGFFKFWKHSHEMDRSKVLEELIDGIHFLLSLAIKKKYDRVVTSVEVFPLWQEYPIEDLFITIRRSDLDSIANFQYVFGLMLGIAKKLDYSEMELRYAYALKNQTNIDRQVEGY